MKLKYLINPFEKIAGIKALLFGLFAIILASIIGFKTNTHFDGVLSVHSGRETPYIIYFLEPLISWLYASTIFSIVGFIFSKSKIRLIDIFGTQAFAFIPLLPASFIGAFSVLTDIPEKLSGLEHYEITQNMFTFSELFTLIFIAFFVMFFVVWSAIWMFHGFKLSTNLHNKYLIPFYILTIVSGFLVPNYLLSFINF
ncbi:MAG: hypothetical protein JEZ09_08970 [Salinivirgaceae bacterium]|nr:hypothetical protein [Salinivirgaceae bacterium]